MKLGYIQCDYCKKNLVHPAMLDVKMSYRANVGHGKPSSLSGMSGGVMGFVEIDIEGDFCDGECLQHYAYQQALLKDYSVGKVEQDIFFRGGPTEPGEPK